MGNGASLSFKGPLSRVCRAARESVKVFLKVKMIVLLSKKRIHSCITFQFSLLEPFIVSNVFQFHVLLESALGADLHVIAMP